VVVTTKPAPAKNNTSTINLAAEGTDLTIVFTPPSLNTRAAPDDGHGQFDAGFSTRKGRLLLAALCRF